MSDMIATSTYRVQAHSTSSGRAQVGAGTETVAFDASWAAGPSGLPGPGELLAAAFAACLLKNVERASQLLPFEYRSAEVDVTARRQDARPKFVDITYELRLVTDEPERRVELLHHNLHRHGTVGADRLGRGGLGPQLGVQFGEAFPGLGEGRRSALLPPRS